MALNYVGQLDAINDPIYLAKVTQSAVKTAIAVNNEAPSVAFHAQRVAFATAVLNNPTDLGRKLTHGVATQVAGATPTDANIDTAVSSIWNAYAGVVTTV